jgi:hypothetical protein
MYNPQTVFPYPVFFEFVMPVNNKIGPRFIKSGEILVKARADGKRISVYHVEYNGADITNLIEFIGHNFPKDQFVADLNALAIATHNTLPDEE